MARFVKINNIEYPVIEILGRMRNNDWDNRESKTIHLTMTYSQAMSIFHDGTEWSIIEEWEEVDPESSDPEAALSQQAYITRREEYDNSDFNVAGDVTDHRDGTLSITMGKETDLEEAYELLYGGDL